MEKKNKDLLQKGTWLGLICSIVGIVFTLLGQDIVGYVAAPMFFFLIIVSTKGKPNELVNPFTPQPEGRGFSGSY